MGEGGGGAAGSEVASGKEHILRELASDGYGLRKEGEV